jgi:hypothetical protein
MLENGTEVARRISSSPAMIPHGKVATYMEEQSFYGIRR